MRYKMFLYFYVTLALSLMGCSTLHVTMNPADDIDGIRTYGSAPYLQVTAPVVVDVISWDLLSFDNQAGKFSTVTLPQEVTLGDQKRAVEPAGQRFPFEQRRSRIDLVSLSGPSGSGSKVGNAPDQPGKPKIEGTDIPGKDATASPADQSDSPKSAPASPVTIAYLPDGCREFAISQSNFLSSSSLGLTLKDGWQLATLQSSGDTTAIVKSIIDGAASVLGAGAKASGGGGAGGGSKAQGATAQFFVHLRTHVLKPGLYALTKRIGASPDKPCSGRLEFVSPFKDDGNLYKSDQLIPLAVQ
jgi:hypothetical protein